MIYQQNVVNNKEADNLSTNTGFFLRRFAPMLMAAFLLCLCACTGGTATPPAQSAHGEGATADAPLVLLYLSDTQADPAIGDYSGFGTILSQALAVSADLYDGRKPDLLLLGGDAVNDGADESEWRDLHQAVGLSFEGMTVAAAAGNHDNNALLAEQFLYPDTTPERGRGWFYSFTIKGVHITVLDSNIMGAANAEDIAWLESTLSASAAEEADWRIALCHHPFFPVSSIPRDLQRAQTMREYFLPLLEHYGVDLILTGHQHVYARSLPMQKAEPTQEGVIHVMAASGDKASYTPEDRPYLAVTAPAPNYVLITAQSGELSLTAYDANDDIVDTFSITK